MDLRIPEVERLEKKVDRLETILSDLVVTAGYRATVTIKDVARIEGVSISQLRPGGRQRYLLPRFGDSGYPTGTCRWDLTEYLDWRKQDPYEREMAYRRHLEAEMKRRRSKCSTASASTMTRSGTR